MKIHLKIHIKRALVDLENEMAEVVAKKASQTNLGKNEKLSSNRILLEDEKNVFNVFAAFSLDRK